MKLAATDFDGTFAPHRQPVPASNIEAVAKWQAAGHKFGICTGRGLSLIEFELKKYPALHPDYLVCNNGAVVVNNKREFLASLCLPQETVKGLLRMSTDMFAQCIHIPFSKIVPINTVLPGLWIIKTKQNLHNGRLTSTRITDKCHIAAPFYGQANILQNLLFF